ncbi:MAG: DUF3341 domain-containing protein [Myxococcota bacterium]
MPTLVSVFKLPAEVVKVVTKLRGRGFDEIETYSPAPFPEIDDAMHEKPSPVRLYTLIGGLIGVVSGFAMAIWMSLDWPLKIGGKPFASIPPYVIIGFELTILLGGLFTLLGLLVVGRLVPRFKMDPCYSPRFSAEDFGVVIRCEDRDVAEIDALLRASAAVEVTLVES